MTHQERWQSDRRTEEYGSRERSYGESEGRGPGSPGQRYDPYEREDVGGRAPRREDPWEGSSSGRGGYGSRFGARDEEEGRGGYGRRDEYRGSRQGERFGSDEARERGYGSSGQEYERSGRGSQRGYGASEGSWGRPESSPRYGDSPGGPQSWYGDSGRGPQSWYADSGRDPQFQYGDRSYGDRGSSGPYRGSEQRGFEGQGGSGSMHRGSGGSSYGSSWGGEGRSEGGSSTMGRPSWGSTPYSSAWSGEGRSGMERPGWQSSRESHRGKGPKNYRRSDERIHEEICERLKQHADLDASEIEVQVKAGTVTLTGTVSERAEKRMAEDAIDDISGVADVNNQVRVRQSSSSSSSPTSSTSGSSMESLTPAARSTEPTDGSREKARPTASR